MSEHEIDRETIETDAGDYVVTWFYDESAEQPCNEGLGLAWDGGHRYGDYAEGEHAAEVLAILKNGEHSSAAIARYLRIAYGLKGIREVSDSFYTYAPSTERGSTITGIAWAPDDVPDEHAEKYTDSSLEEWRAWSEGDTFGWVLTGPNGNEVEGGAVWGYYGFSREREYTLSEARNLARYDAAERIKKANLAGAGFVGVI